MSASSKGKSCAGVRMRNVIKLFVFVKLKEGVELDDGSGALVGCVYGFTTNCLHFSDTHTWESQMLGAFSVPRPRRIVDRLA